MSSPGEESSAELERDRLMSSLSCSVFNSAFIDFILNLGGYII